MNSDFVGYEELSRTRRVLFRRQKLQRHFFIMWDAEINRFAIVYLNLCFVFAIPVFSQLIQLYFHWYGDALNMTGKQLRILLSANQNSYYVLQIKTDITNYYKIVYRRSLNLRQNYVKTCLKKKMAFRHPIGIKGKNVYFMLV